MRKLMVLSAGLSSPSTTRQVADTIAQAVEAAVTSRGESLEITTVEIAELTNDLASMMTTGISSPRLDEVRFQLSDADGLIAVTPIFKASYSGLFKMFFDVLDQDALNGMPTIIAATAGTPRHSLVLDYALRPLLTYLRADVVPTGLFAATDDFGSDDGENFQRRVGRAAGELASRMVALGPDAVGGLGGITADGQRNSGVDLNADVTPFAQMLKGLDGNN